ncbi:Uncharacterised protein [Streptococcus pneumoniae]|nr:Uncharacterised protein [Streptococcus pneumoniae]CJI50681.1 Uncharacterised protein [Streptococcus pneumoniae]
MTYTWDAVDVIALSSAAKEGVPFVKKEQDTGIPSFRSTAAPICCNSCIGCGSLLPRPTSKILLPCIGIASRILFTTSSTICGCVLKGGTTENVICGYFFCSCSISKGISRL